MWSFLKELTPSFVGLEIFSFLDLKSIVILERALAGQLLQQTFKTFLIFTPTFNNKIKIPPEGKKYKWLQDRQCRIMKGTVWSNMITADYDSIDQIKFRINSTINMNTIDYLSDKTYQNITEIVIYEANQDVLIIETLFFRMKNIHTMKVLRSIDNWIETALNSNIGVSLQHLSFGNIRITQSIVVIIAQNCPKLLMLKVNKFIDTTTALITLSEYKLPKEELEMSTWIPDISEALLPQCVYALSRIVSIYTPLEATATTTIPHNYTIIIPYLTGLKIIGELSLLLRPLFIQLQPQLECLQLDWSCSTGIQHILQLLHNSSATLKSLSLYCNDEEGSILLETILPYCRNLQKLYVRNSHVTTVTDSSILAISEHCNKLQELDISSCKKITEAAVVQLLQQCKQLCTVILPLKCLSEDTVLTLPGKVVVGKQFMTLQLSYKKIPY